MEIHEQEIIVLENLERYIILNNVEIENKKYFLAMGLKENNDIIPSKVLFVETEFDGQNLFIIKVKNQDLIIKLAKLLKNK